ncbi:DUF4296 domain-containing protein [Mucilaginibacter sp.]|uniref:DUF4296 domain-containing protein n=1 Tax=Mucilaginibacter sp. TaxID=1882438 RepID=UPI0035BBFFDC
MHKYIILFFSVLAFFASCVDDAPPPGIIPEQQMVGLLTDLHLVDGQLYSVQQLPDSIYKYGVNKYRAVFKQYKTNDANFKKSLKYYSTKPEQIQAIYDSVQSIIKFKTDSVTKIGTKKLKNAIPVQ